MDEIIELTDEDLEYFIGLMSGLEYGNDVRKVSVRVDGDGVSFKINEFMWSYPLGKPRNS